jgi:response regulator RpfG family c-di-GMP phosphodiesterase
MLQFAKEEKKEVENSLSKWKILIADDETEVHNITKTVLRKFTFDDRGLEFFSAYSGKEAIEILKKNPDISLILLDVVMESDDAGLKVAKAIREELNNKSIRIVLRTGQPGSAPEKNVILDYDINDYKEKTELTANKLFTTVVSSLRASRDIVTIEHSKIGLQKIIESSKSMFKEKSLSLFVEGVLTQLVSILNLSDGLGKIQAKDAFFATLENDEFKVLATVGKYQKKDIPNILTLDAVSLLHRAQESRNSFFQDDKYIGYFQSEDDKTIFLYLEGCAKLDNVDKNLLEIFSNNISIAFNNICLNNEIIDTQAEIVGKLGEIIENRSQETANHVNRVAYISYVLAKAYGLSEDYANKIRLASPMHDIGKVAIADNILLKPGKLTKDEFNVIKTHSKIGWEILKGSKREILKLAATIAYEHHEKWDGSGYPRGISGEEISISGRITAIADVFDALTQKRVYKDAWELKRVIKLFEEERGKHFEPKLVDLFLENLPKIKKIMK